ncbi:unnamed protein product [Lasius platythorax]|uniref:Uncharacterized protein n=1 Tax=Lasius platythorax TaxID=488582 RepID=A0AAV2P735_9HYME
MFVRADSSNIESSDPARTSTDVGIIWRAEREWLPVAAAAADRGISPFMREARNRIHESPHLSDGSIKPAGEHRGKRRPAAIWRHKDSPAHSLGASEI